MVEGKLPDGWTRREGRLRARYAFKDFVRAIGFLQEVAFKAESQQHHPDFSVHWNEVGFEVWTHDAGRVTPKDEKLVASIAKIAVRHKAKFM